jgi:hypothetical protein
MGKHESGYPRIERDLYPTPRWPVDALLEHIDIAGLRIWEPACGDGRMVEVLKGAAADVYATHIEDRGYTGLDRLIDFTMSTQLEFFKIKGDNNFTGIVTNPPLGQRGKLAVAFIQVGLVRMGEDGFLALLLPSDFDSAKARRLLFGKCARFVGKIILTRRIKWFDSGTADHSKNLKESSAWFLWGNVPFRPDVLALPSNHSLCAKF